MPELDNTYDIKFEWMGESGRRKRWALAKEVLGWKWSTIKDSVLTIAKDKQEVTICGADVKGNCVVCFKQPYREHWIDFDKDLQGAIRFAVNVLSDGWEKSVKRLGEE